MTKMTYVNVNLTFSLCSYLYISKQATLYLIT